MFGLSIVIAALAMMGAPTSTPVDCNATTTAQKVALGLTWTYTDTGEIIRTDYAPMICAGLTFMAASPAEQTKLRVLNPTVDFARDEGVALLVVLHESHHATGDLDETSTECAAMAALPGFITRYVPVQDQPIATVWAQRYDAAFGPMYHTHPCG